MTMLRKHRTISTFLIVSLSFILPMASAYFNYNTVIEADFLTRGVKFEGEDIDGFSVDKQINLDFLPSGSFIIASREINLQGLPITSFYQVNPIDSFFSVLRC
jgi:hypothetical protein